MGCSTRSGRKGICSAGAFSTSAAEPGDLPTRWRSAGRRCGESTPRPRCSPRHAPVPEGEPASSSGEPRRSRSRTAGSTEPCSVSPSTSSTERPRSRSSLESFGPEGEPSSRRSGRSTSIGSGSPASSRPSRRSTSKRFADPVTLAAELEEAGFRTARTRKALAGGAHRARRGPGAAPRDATSRRSPSSRSRNTWRGWHGPSASSRTRRSTVSSGRYVVAEMPPPG